MSYWLGIDGGGTGVRVAIINQDVQVMAEVRGEAANPNSAGREAAQERIRAMVRQALVAANLTEAQIAGAGVGVAGASVEYNEPWLRETLLPVLPSVAIAYSSDEEIALVGARAALHGVVVAAGTGSVAYGCNEAGERMRMGGWGYLLGDEGSGYWIGREALRSVTYEHDRLTAWPSTLPQRVLDHLGLARADDLIAWRYQYAEARDVAALAPLVMQAAAAEDSMALSILETGTGHLARYVRTIRDTLRLPPETVVFGGSLLTADTLYRAMLIQQLGIQPEPSRYSSVVGAALLAKLRAAQSEGG